MYQKKKLGDCVKKILLLTSVGLIAAIMFLLCFSYDRPIHPNAYYQVYLDGKVVGTIESKRELEDYINNQGKEIRKNVKDYKEKIDNIDIVNEVLNNLKLSEEETTSFNSLSTYEKYKYIIKNAARLKISEVKKSAFQYCLDNEIYTLTESEIEEMRKYVNENQIYLSAKTIYTPNGIDIKRINTYKNDVDQITDIYAKIVSKKNCTIAGYKFTIKSKTEKKKDLEVYVTDNKLFSEAVDTLASIFTGNDEYKAYKEKTQNDIIDTGSIIENVYVDEDITYKAMNISTDEKIYTNVADLAKFLLYGDQYHEKQVKVEDGDSISSIAFNNKISVSEFLISNDDYTSKDNLLYPGKEVVIAKINPQIGVVVEKHNVQDVEANFNTVEQYDDNMLQGDEEVTQEGEKGLERVTQSVKYINGQVNYVQTDKKETLKAPTTKIVTVGSKIVPHIGSTKSWGWPTNSGYSITSGFEYRISPVGNGHELHTGLDICGTGYGSPVYASNNGVIVEMTNHYSYGNYIMINHNNGYYSLYAHMSGFANGMKVGKVVERGQQIGMVGATGAATGPHLHYEIRTCDQHKCAVDPMKFY